MASKVVPTVPTKPIPSDEYTDTVANATATASTHAGSPTGGGAAPAGHTSPPKAAPTNSPKYVSPQNFLDNINTRYQK